MNDYWVPDVISLQWYTSCGSSRFLFKKLLRTTKFIPKIIYMVYKLPLIIFCCWKSFVDVLNKAILKSLLYCTKISFLHNPHLINVLINVRICLNFFITKILKIIRELCSSKTLEKLSNMLLLFLKCDTHKCTCREQKSNTEAEEYNRKNPLKLNKM